MVLARSGQPALWVQRAVGLLLVVATLIAAQDLPRYGVALFVAASVYLLAVIKLPRLWLVVLPVLCVSLDLAPWTGRFLYNELDAFFWVTIGAALICARYRIPDWGNWEQNRRRGAILVAGFVALACLTGGTSGLLWRPPAEVFGDPYVDPRFAYKVLKGMLWATLLLPLWLELRLEDPARTRACLEAGAAAAALLLFTVILWERGTLAALAQGPGPALASFLDLATAYRTTGLFSDMHTGGESLDGAIILLLAISAHAAVFAANRRLALLAGAAVFALAYVTLVGFTRSTYAGFALTLSLLAAQQLLRCRDALALTWTRVLLLALLLPMFFLSSYLAARAGGGTLAVVVIVEGAVLLTVLRGRPRGALRRGRGVALAALLIPQLFALGLTAETMDARLLGIERDLDTRLEHWFKVVSLRSESIGSALLGEGAGAFPAMYRDAFAPSLDWIGRFVVQRDPPRLVLGTGGDLHVYQRLPGGATELGVEVTARAHAGGWLSVSYCARNILDTGGWRDRCDTQRIRLIPGDKFETHGLVLSLPNRARHGVAAGWPRALHLRALPPGDRVEVDTVGITQGGAALYNGGFDRGMDGWFFTTHLGHLPYHVKNLWLQLWFEYGWVGLLLFLAMVMQLGLRARRAPPGDDFLPLAALAVYALGGLGVFASPLDSARVSWLFFLLLFAGLTEPSGRSAQLRRRFAGLAVSSDAHGRPG
ncbi:MAG: hypothetical protein V2I24_10320 [Halieaceae bacterium]|nr:hypothetical protein [Halieaceae bacterium]